MNRWVALGAVALAILLGRRRRSIAVVDPHAVVDVDALARVITSESNGYTEAERLAIAWTVRNRARRRGVSIAHLVCWPSCGPQGKDRPFSSARAATETNRALAQRVLAAPQSDDPTRGATAFFEPRVQDRLVADGRPGYRFTSEQLRARWQREGQQQLATVGKFEFWV
jgi:spore germination cell wall hydrolase CwlJ-like protein